MLLHCYWLRHHIRSTHHHRFGIHRHAGEEHLLHAFDNHAIARLEAAFDDAQAATLARSDAELSDATEPLPYLVFDADQRYATPVEGIVGVVELPTQAREDLRQGRQAVLAWRGQTVRLVSLPAIARTGGHHCHWASFWVTALPALTTAWKSATTAP